MQQLSSESAHCVFPPSKRGGQFRRGAWKRFLKCVGTPHLNLRGGAPGARIYQRRVVLAADWSRAPVWYPGLPGPSPKGALLPSLRLVGPLSYPGATHWLADEPDGTCTEPRPLSSAVSVWQTTQSAHLPCSLISKSRLLNASHSDFQLDRSRHHLAGMF